MMKPAFEIPPSVAAKIGDQPPSTFRCKHHGIQFGDRCEFCQMERERMAKAMFARCEDMGLAPRYHCLRFSSYITDIPGQAEALEAAREFLDGKHLTLVFVGSTASEGFGTGKTTLAASILYEKYLRDQVTGIYATADRLFSELKDAIDAKAGMTQQIRDRLIRARLLVIDEIGTYPLTAFDKKTISEILAERIDFGRQTIIISNKDRKTLWANFHARTQDRLRGSSRGVVFDWESERGK